MKILGSICLQNNYLTKEELIHTICQGLIPDQERFFQIESHNIALIEHDQKTRFCVIYIKDIDFIVIISPSRGENYNFVNQIGLHW